MLEGVCPHSKDPDFSRYIKKCRVCEFDGLLCPPECYNDWTKCPYITKRWVDYRK